MKVEVDQTAVASALDPANKHVDRRTMDAVGRLGGHGYSRTPRSVRPADDDL